MKEEQFICPPAPIMKRVCLLYVDILGFSSFIKHHGMSESHEIIHRAIWCSLTFAKGFNKIVNDTEIKYKGYSDNFVFYLELNGGPMDQVNCAWLLNLAAYLQEEFITVANLQIRGAVTIGDCYIGDYIFGKAYEVAYELESKHADWARVLVSDEVIEQVKSLLPFIPMLNDGSRLYLDFLPVSINPENNKSYREHIELLTEHFYIIYSQLYNEINNAETMGQVVELAKHLNRCNRMRQYIEEYRKRIGLEYKIDQSVMSNSMPYLWTRFQNSLTNLTLEDIEQTKQNLDDLVSAYKLSLFELEKVKRKVLRN